MIPRLLASCVFQETRKKRAKRKKRERKENRKRYNEQKMQKEVSNETDFYYERFIPSSFPLPLSPPSFSIGRRVVKHVFA